MGKRKIKRANAVGMKKKKWKYSDAQGRKLPILTCKVAGGIDLSRPIEIKRCFASDIMFGGHEQRTVHVWVGSDMLAPVSD